MHLDVATPEGHDLPREGETLVDSENFAGLPSARDTMAVYLDWPWGVDWWRFANYLSHCFGYDQVEFLGNAVRNGEAFHCEKQGI